MQLNKNKLQHLQDSIINGDIYIFCGFQLTCFASIINAICIFVSWQQAMSYIWTTRRVWQSTSCLRMESSFEAAASIPYRRPGTLARYQHQQYCAMRQWSSDDSVVTKGEHPLIEWSIAHYVTLSRDWAFNPEFKLCHFYLTGDFLDLISRMPSLWCLKHLD